MTTVSVKDGSNEASAMVTAPVPIEKLAVCVPLIAFEFRIELPQRALLHPAIAPP